MTERLTRYSRKRKATEHVVKLHKSEKTQHKIRLPPSWSQKLREGGALEDGRGIDLSLAALSDI